MHALASSRLWAAIKSVGSTIAYCYGGLGSHFQVCRFARFVPSRPFKLRLFLPLHFCYLDCVKHFISSSALYGRTFRQRTIVMTIVFQSDVATAALFISRFRSGFEQKIAWYVTIIFTWPSHWPWPWQSHVRAIFSSSFFFFEICGLQIWESANASL